MDALFHQRSTKPSGSREGPEKSCQTVSHIPSPFAQESDLKECVHFANVMLTLGTATPFLLLNSPPLQGFVSAWGMPVNFSPITFLRQKYRPTSDTSVCTKNYWLKLGVVNTDPLHNTACSSWKAPSDYSFHFTKFKLLHLVRSISGAAIGATLLTKL